MTFHVEYQIIENFESKSQRFRRSVNSRIFPLKSDFIPEMKKGLLLTNLLKIS